MTNEGLSVHSLALGICSFLGTNLKCKMKCVLTALLLLLA